MASTVVAVNLSGILEDWTRDNGKPQGIFAIGCAGWRGGSGGEVYFSEVGVQAGTLRKQAKMYHELAELAARQLVERFVVWGVRDPTWRGNVTVFDSQGNPKPAYYTLNSARAYRWHRKYRMI